MLLEYKEQSGQCQTAEDPKHNILPVTGKCSNCIEKGPNTAENG